MEIQIPKKLLLIVPFAVAVGVSCKNDGQSLQTSSSPTEIRLYSPKGQLLVTLTDDDKIKNVYSIVSSARRRKDLRWSHLLPSKTGLVEMRFLNAEEYCIVCLPGKKIRFVRPAAVADVNLIWVTKQVSLVEAIVAEAWTELLIEGLEHDREIVIQRRFIPDPDHEELSYVRVENWLLARNHEGPVGQFLISRNAFEPDQIIVRTSNDTSRIRVVRLEGQKTIATLNFENGTFTAEQSAHPAWSETASSRILFIKDISPNVENR